MPYAVEQRSPNRPPLSNVLVLYAIVIYVVTMKKEKSKKRRE
jgi:hypothetical protein